MAVVSASQYVSIYAPRRPTYYTPNGLAQRQAVLFRLSAGAGVRCVANPGTEFRLLDPTSDNESPETLEYIH